MGFQQPVLSGMCGMSFDRTDLPGKLDIKAYFFL